MKFKLSGRGEKRVLSLFRHVGAFRLTVTAKREHDKQMSQSLCWTLILLGHFFAAFSVQGCVTPPEQQQALVDLYYSTSGQYWTSSQGWTIGDACGNNYGTDGWFGLFCNYDCTILNIVLTNNNLTGHIPPSLSNITTLNRMMLSENNFLSQGWPDLSAFPELRIINLENTNFVGAFPDISSLQYLTDVRISYNDASQTPLPVFNPSVQLNVFYASHSRFAGTIPESYAQFNTVLTEFRVDQNRLVSPLPLFLQNDPTIAWPNVHIIYLYLNVFTCPMPGWCQTLSGSDCSNSCTCTPGCDDCGPGCNDFNSCTSDSCGLYEGCINTPVSGSSCDDGFKCTDNDACTNDGECVGTPISCNPPGLCESIACSESSGKCESTLFQGGSICRNATDDCDVAEYCDGVSPSCPPDLLLPNGYVCRQSAGTCDPAESCDGVSASCPNDSLFAYGTPCDDGQFCNDGTICDGSSPDCMGGYPLDCSDGISCTSDSCDERGGQCVHDPVDSACDDTLDCNGAETCVPGNPLAVPSTGCLAGTAVDCSDGIPCTVDTCNEPGSTCSNTPNDSFCSDNDVCTGVETCNPLSGCVAGTPLSCNARGPCETASCDAMNGCVFTPLSSSIACRNSTGSCDQIEYCDGVNYSCPADISVSPGTPCDDGLFCTVGETCSGFICSGGQSNSCSDGFSCTVDTCDEAGDKCDNTPNNVQCDDGLKCNGAETCVPGNPLAVPSTGCLAGTAVDCSDGIPCTVDTCNEPGSTCSNTPNDIICSDGDVCTGVETCNPLSGCVAGTPLSCNARGPCETASCSQRSGCLYAPLNATTECRPSTGLCDVAEVCDGINFNCPPEVFQPSSVTCNDGTACTRDDTCQNGFCVGILYSCDDNNDCTNDICDGNGGCLYSPSGLCSNCSNCISDDPCVDAVCDQAKGICNMIPNSGRDCSKENDVCGVKSTCLRGICIDQGSVCDDNNLCTQDICTPLGERFSCDHAQIDCFGPNQDCVVSVCNPSTGVCEDSAIQSDQCKNTAVPTPPDVSPSNPTVQSLLEKLATSNDGSVSTALVIGAISLIQSQNIQDPAILDLAASSLVNVLQQTLDEQQVAQTLAAMDSLSQSSNNMSDEGNTELSNAALISSTLILQYPSLQSQASTYNAILNAAGFSYEASKSSNIIQEGVLANTDLTIVNCETSITQYFANNPNASGLALSNKIAQGSANSLTIGQLLNRFSKRQQSECDSSFWFTKNTKFQNARNEDQASYIVFNYLIDIYSELTNVTADSGVKGITILDSAGNILEIDPNSRGYLMFPLPLNSQEPDPKNPPQCVFYDEDTKTWSDRGCKFERYGDFREPGEFPPPSCYICRCSHYTNFGVLLGVEGANGDGNGNNNNNGVFDNTQFLVIFIIAWCLFGFVAILMVIFIVFYAVSPSFRQKVSGRRNKHATKLRKERSSLRAPTVEAAARENSTRDNYYA